MIINLYELGNNNDRLRIHLAQLCDLFIARSAYESLTEIMSRFDEVHGIFIFQKIALSLLRNNAPEFLITNYLEKALYALMHDNSHKNQLGEFLQTIQGLHEHYYHYAYNLIQSAKN